MKNMKDGGTEFGRTLTVNIPPIKFASEKETKVKMNILKSDIVERLKSYIGLPNRVDISESAQEMVNALSENLAEEYNFTVDLFDKEKSKEYNKKDAEDIGLIL